AVTTREARQRRHYFDQIGRGVRSGRTAGSRAGEHTAPRLFLQGAKRGLVSAREFRDAAGSANISRQPPMRIRKGNGAAAHSQFAFYTQHSSTLSPQRPGEINLDGVSAAARFS